MTTFADSHAAPPTGTAEVIALAAALKRCSFLLNSTRLVITDQVARDIAAEAVAEANDAIAAYEARGHA
jgi:hypothetical protein